MKKAAFTLSEVLATLTVIGIIAAITIPSVIVDTRQAGFEARKKALRHDLVDISKILTTVEGGLNKAEAEGTTRTANQVFVEDYLSKYMKLGRICDPDHIEDCGFYTDDTYLNPDSSANVSLPFENKTYWSDNTEKAWGAIMANGTSLLISYNPDCTGNKVNWTNTTDDTTGSETTTAKSVNDYACVNIVFDTNGDNAPNILGKDLGHATIFYPKKGKVAVPVPYKNSYSKVTSLSAAQNYCTKASSHNDALLPTAEEAASLDMNTNFLPSLISSETPVWFASANDSKYSSFKGKSAICVK